MGLDMYLSARKYIGDWEHSGKEERKQYGAITKALGLNGFRCEGSPHLYVEVGVCYWRKANQIHKWFVDTVQNGQDECQDSYVSREQLQNLLTLAKEVKEKRDPKLLPTQKGFFFGSTEIDEGYWQDIDDTISQLTAVLENPVFKDWDFEYRASW